jgi:hypothetical protein
MSTRSGDGWSGTIEGQAPVQGCGRVDGHGWYFRARHEAWSLEIVEDPSIDPETLPVVNDACPGWLAEEGWGSSKFEASYMPEEVAWSLVERCFENFRRGRLSHVPG